jgi:hypothetical protein
MNQKTLQAVLVGAGVLVVLNILASQPNCNRGCKTVLEHITKHVLADTISAALGA